MKYKLFIPSAKQTMYKMRVLDFCHFSKIFGIHSSKNDSKNLITNNLFKHIQ